MNIQTEWNSIILSADKVRPKLKRNCELNKNPEKNNHSFGIGTTHIH